jgi:hypothetical protein
VYRSVKKTLENDVTLFVVPSVRGEGTEVRV